MTYGLQVFNSSGVRTFTSNTTTNLARPVSVTSGMMTWTTSLPADKTFTLTGGLTTDQIVVWPNTTNIGFKVQSVAQSGSDLLVTIKITTILLTNTGTNFVIMALRRVV
jgi:hypothetical protein